MKEQQIVTSLRLIRCRKTVFLFYPQVFPSAVDSFNKGAWYALVGCATVYGREDVRFTFKNGVEIKA